MKDFDWRLRYAPHGYTYVRHHVSFVTLEYAQFPSDVIEIEMEQMRAKIAKDCPYFYDPLLAHTRITVYPKDVGESINHLDPLKPRFGIEIEIRQPLPADISK